MYNINYQKINWYQINYFINKYCNKKCYKNYYCCKCYSDSPPLVYKYIFKEQVYYINCIEGMHLNWIPITIGNGDYYVNYNNNSLISNSLVSSCESLQPLGAIPVIYPDYSNVDVGEGKLWPNKVFSPFVDSTAWPPFQFADVSVTTKVPYYNLGFIVSQSPTICKPTWGTYYSAELGPLNPQIKKLRANGGDVTVSFGGAANTPLHITAPDVDSLFKQYQLFIDAYKLTRIDFDIEGIWIDPSYNQDNIKNSQALKQLQDYYKSKGRSLSIWFTLPVLPTGLTGDGINLLQLALNAGVEIGGVNVMAMDYGDSAAPNPKGRMGMYGIQAITSLKNQLNILYKGSKSEVELWEMIGITPMLGVNDVADEIFAQSDAFQILSFAQFKNIGQISMWSCNRDMTSASKIIQNDNEFSLIFNAYNQ